MQEELETIDAVSRAVDRVIRKGRFAEFELSNGIVLTMRPVPPMLTQAVMKEFTPPSPPKVYMEEKGREEENPNDPAYLKLIEELAEKQERAMGDLLLAVGTEIKHVPENYYKPEDDAWIRQVEFASKVSNTHIQLDLDDQIKRYLCWLRFYAFETAADVALASGLPLQLAGIREGEVEEVIDSFQRIQGRRADTERSSEAGHQNGNTAVPDPSGDSF